MLILVLTVTGCVSISAFASLVCVLHELKSIGQLFHDVINLLYYEYWTDKQKYFYLCDKIVLLEKTKIKYYWRSIF